MYLFSLRKKCPYLEFFWYVFSRIRTKYGDLQRKSTYSVKMQENTDKKNSEYGHFLNCVLHEINPYNTVLYLFHMQT